MNNLNKKFTITLAGIFMLLIQFILLNGYYDEGNFLFGSYGDDFQYINNFQYINGLNFKLIGLAISGEITGYNYFLYICFKYGNIYLLYFFEFVLYFISNFYFFKIAQHSLGEKYAKIALFLFLIFPLRYLWLFSFYKDSLVLSLCIIFIYQTFFKNKRTLSVLSGSLLFLFRPVLLVMSVIIGYKNKIKFRHVFILIISLITISILIDNYNYFNEHRFEYLSKKIKNLPFNSGGEISIIYLPLIWIFTMIQPIFLINKEDNIWNNTALIVQIDSFIRLFLAPLIIQGLLYFKTYLKDIKITLVFKALLLFSLSLAVAFMFLTSRHVLILLPWQIIFALYVYKKQKYNHSLVFLFIILIVAINFITEI